MYSQPGVPQQYYAQPPMQYYPQQYQQPGQGYAYPPGPGAYPPNSMAYGRPQQPQPQQGAAGQHIITNPPPAVSGVGFRPSIVSGPSPQQWNPFQQTRGSGAPAVSYPSSPKRQGSMRTLPYPNRRQSQAPGPMAPPADALNNPWAMAWASAYGVKLQEAEQKATSIQQSFTSQVETVTKEYDAERATLLAKLEADLAKAKEREDEASKKAAEREKELLDQMQQQQKAFEEEMAAFREAKDKEVQELNKKLREVLESGATNEDKDRALKEHAQNLEKLQDEMETEAKRQRMAFAERIAQRRKNK